MPLTVRPGDDNFWLYEAPDGLEAAAKKLPVEERFDAVVVDEGQDFPSIWFPALRLLGKTQDDSSTLYWFYATAEWPKQIGTIPLSDNFDRWRRGECILLSSHRRFKGLEADALILADVPVPAPKTHFTPADFYVACSRAKHHLTVVSRR
jgi:hypothetical protein